MNQYEKLMLAHANVQTSLMLLQSCITMKDYLEVKDIKDLVDAYKDAAKTIEELLIKTAKVLDENEM